MRTDEQTDMTQIVVAFRNSANAPNVSSLQQPHRNQHPSVHLTGEQNKCDMPKANIKGLLPYIHNIQVNSALYSITPRSGFS